MGLKDKFSSFNSIFKIIKSFVSGTQEHLVDITKSAGTIFIDSIEKYKLIRRLILCFIVYLCFDIHRVTTCMYKSTGQVDMQWVIYATAYTAMLALFITFYTTSRTKEMDNAEKRDIQEMWIDSNNNGINDCDEDWYKEMKRKEQISMKNDIMGDIINNIDQDNDPDAINSEVGTTTDAGSNNTTTTISINKK